MKTISGCGTGTGTDTGIGCVSVVVRDTGTASAEAFKVFIRSRALDADLVVSVFEELVTLLLKNRCDTISIDESYDVMVTELPPIEVLVQRSGRVNRRPSAMGKYSHLGLSSDDMAREHQEDIAREEKGWH